MCRLTGWERQRGNASQWEPIWEWLWGSFGCITLSHTSCLFLKQKNRDTQSMKQLYLSLGSGGLSLYIPCNDRFGEVISFHMGFILGSIIVLMFYQSTVLKYIWQSRSYIPWGWTNVIILWNVDRDCFLRYTSVYQTFNSSCSSNDRKRKKCRKFKLFTDDSEDDKQFLLCYMKTAQLGNSCGLRTTQKESKNSAVNFTNIPLFKDQTVKLFLPEHFWDIWDKASTCVFHRHIICFTWSSLNVLLGEAEAVPAC